MSTSIPSSSLVNQLAASYQKLAQAQARVQESKAQVEQNRAQLERSQDRHDNDRKDYAQALQKSRTVQQSDTQYAIAVGSGTQQVPTDTSTQRVASAVSVGSPTVNTSGQTVGSLISVTA